MNYSQIKRHCLMLMFATQKLCYCLLAYCLDKVQPTIPSNTYISTCHVKTNSSATAAVNEFGIYHDFEGLQSKSCLIY